MPGGLYIEGRNIRNFADIQRNYNYEVSFINAGSLIPGWTSDDVTLRARSFTIPQRGNEAIESSYGAMKQFFPGKPTFSNTSDITFEETESQGVATFLYSWQQKIFDVTAGHSNYSRKRGNNAAGSIADTGICDHIVITAYRNGGAGTDPSQEPNKYYLYNAWLQNVAEVNIDYNQAGDSVKFNATFQYDFWVYSPTDPQIGNGNISNPVITPESSN